MRNHTLMQTIARANRVFPGKHSGLIVDYANVFASLEKALAIYGTGRGGATPVRDKAQLIGELRQALEEATVFCAAQGVDLAAIEAARSGSFDRVKLIGEAVEKLISPDPLRKEFLAHERLVSTLSKAVKPDPAVLEFVSRVSCLGIIADLVRQKTGGREPADISGILAEVNRLLDESVAAEAFTIRERETGYGQAIIDLFRIDFEKLAKRFAQSKTKNIELEQLKAAIRAQLNKLVRLNKTRADYLSKFEELIESYNAGSRSIEELFRELVTLSRSLSEERERHVRENLTEEELTVFDILTRPGPELTTEERDEVKKVTRQLLHRLKSLLVLDWRGRIGARATVRQAIEEELDEGLPRAYTPELYQTKVSAVFEHVFGSYQGEGASVFRM
jgi:type I restriction enzyme, R subunit